MDVVGRDAFLEFFYFSFDFFWGTIATNEKLLARVSLKVCKGAVMADIDRCGRVISRVAREYRAFVCRSADSTTHFSGWLFLFLLKFCQILKILDNHVI